MIIQSLRNAPRGKGDSGLCYEALWGGGGRLKWYCYVALFSRATDCFFFTSEKVIWAMSRKNLFYWNLTSSISVYCRLNDKSHSGWSIFLCHLSEIECSEQVSWSFRDCEIFRRKKFFTGNNFRRHKLFVGKYFRHLTKNSSRFANKVFTDKV